MYTDSSLETGADVSSMRSGNLVNWTDSDTRSYGAEPLVVTHSLHELPMFSDESLIELLDNYPRETLQVFTMGDDPEDRSQWQPVDNREAGGRDILQAVSVGKLWVKLMRTDLVSDDYRDLMEAVYGEIRRKNHRFESLWLRPLMLISSPGALVYYHTDAQNMMLWQIRGTKRVWVYPNHEPFLQPEAMEDIFAGDADEEIPYQAAFDAGSFQCDLTPGNMLSWPLNSPHRVTNLDSVNVSLSVSVGTELADKRSQLYQANRMLRRRLRLRRPSISEHGLNSFVKRNGFRVARKLGMAPGMYTNREPYVAKLRIDANSPSGLSPVPNGTIETLF